MTGCGHDREALFRDKVWSRLGGLVSLLRARASATKELFYDREFSVAIDFLVLFYCDKLLKAFPSQHRFSLSRQSLLDLVSQ